MFKVSLILSPAWRSAQCLPICWLHLSQLQLFNGSFTDIRNKFGIDDLRKRLDKFFSRVRSETTLLHFGSPTSNVVSPLSPTVSLNSGDQQVGFVQCVPRYSPPAVASSYSLASLFATPSFPYHFHLHSHTTLILIPIPLFNPHSHTTHPRSHSYCLPLSVI